MTKENEGVAPKSETEEALAELQKEGYEVEGQQPADNPEGEEKSDPVPPKEESKPEDKPKEETPREETPEDKPKVERKPLMVEAWKLKVAEDQKAGLEKSLAEVQTKLDELSKQKGPVSEAQKTDIADDIKAISEEYGVDPDFTQKITDTILKKALPSAEVAKTLEQIQEERELEKQDNLFNKEFENDVLPLVKEHNLPDQALSQLKKSLKDLAFSETYAKVPLKEIFKLKEDTFDLKGPKKSAEGKGVKARPEIVDLDNVSEEQFAQMSPEQVEEFMNKKQSTGGWQRK